MGTRQRLWLEVLIGTGARRGDANAYHAVFHVLASDNHGMISIRTEKQDVWAFVPVLHDMMEAIKHCPTGSLTFIVGARGENLKKESFGNMFRAACNAAGVRKSAHGLRKYATTAYAEAGLSDSELETIFGWVPGSSMAAHYRKTAERKRIAEGAAGKLVNKLSPHPSPVDRTAKKG
jgi:integrase